MSDKIVYVHENHESDTVTIITPKAFDALLEQGWEIKLSETKKVSGKHVMMHHIYKPSKERGLATVQPSERDESHALMEHQHRGGNDARGVMVAPSNNSFLGTPDFNNLPGMQVTNSLQLQNAYARGTDAANRGWGKESNPYVIGTIASTQWLKGYAAGSHGRGAQSSDLGGLTHDAYELGRAAGAMADPDLEVHCPYPPRTIQRDEWLRGFKEAGGRVE